MVEKEKIMEVLFSAIDEFNEEQPTERQLDKSRDTVLFGRLGKIDSLALVSLIVAIEEKIGEQFQTPITLADERAMSQKTSPFRNVGTLADYIALILGEIADA